MGIMKNNKTKNALPTFILSEKIIPVNIENPPLQTAVPLIEPALSRGNSAA